MSLSKIFVSSLMVWQASAHAGEFAGASGSFIVAAPTALNGPTTEGVWFVRNGATSLNLPDLGADRVYEGWLVDNCTGKKISMGLFRADGKIDSDAAGQFAGPRALNYPPVPGSDFVKLGHNLVDGGHVVVITAEPYPDTDPNPSGVVVLSADIPAETAVGTEIQLQQPAH